MKNNVVTRGLFLMLLIAGLFIFGINNGQAAYITSGDSQWLQNASSIYYSLGNVGIGTTAPQAKLHLENTSAGVNEFIRLSTANAYGAGAKISWWLANNTSEVNRIENIITTDGTTSGHMLFSTYV